MPTAHPAVQGVEAPFKPGQKDPKMENRAQQGKRKSQRPSWSCTECTRRKIRCDRVVPGCNQCIKRNKVHLCRLEYVVFHRVAANSAHVDIVVTRSQDAEVGFGPGSAPAATPAAAPNPQQPRYATAAEYEAVLRSVGVVRQRLHHLDRIISAFVPQPDVLDDDGQVSYAVDMNLLANGSFGKADSGDFSVSSGSGYYASGMVGTPSAEPTPAGGAHLPLGAAPPGIEPYEASSGFHIDGMTPQMGTAPLPSAASNYDQTPFPAPVEQLRGNERMTESDGEVEAAVTLEFLALGRDRKQDHFSRAELRRPSPSEEEPASPDLASATLANPPLENPSTSTLFNGARPGDPASPPKPVDENPTSPLAPFYLSLLPDQSLSDPLIDFSLDRVGWQHAAVHAGQFRAEVAEFLSWGEKEERGRKVNQAWLGLYFAMLCAGVKHMSVEDSQEYGVQPEYQQRLPKLYFDAAIDALHRANFLAKHSIYSVQAIVVLVIACQDVGGSDLIATLLACGIRIAQALNLHRFASDEQWEAKRRTSGVEPTSEAGVKGLIQREVRKRLWYALCSEDWYSIPYRRAYAIFPSHVTTPPPVNCLDSDLSTGILVRRSQDQPTVVSKILIAYKVAACIRNFFEHVNSSLDSDLSYEKLLEADREIRRIIDEGPAYLKPGNEPDDGGLSRGWLPWFKRYWTMSVSHKLLICHRVFLGRAFRDVKYAYSRKVAIEAARSVIQELVRGKHMPYQDVWTVPYHTISAATTIILDIFQTPSSDPDLVNKRHEVQLALDELRLYDNEGSSAIAARGVQLLATLLAEEAKHRRPAGADLRKRKAVEVDGHDTTDGFGDVAKRMVSNSRTPLAATVALPGAGFPLVSPSLATATFPYFAPTSSALPFAYPFGTTAAPPGAATSHPSPVGSHASDASLTLDAFDHILQNLAGWSANPPAGVDDPFLGVGVSGAGESPGTLAVGAGAGVGGTAAYADADFFRMLDLNLEPPTFDISTGFDLAAGGAEDLLGGAGAFPPGGAAPW
ncbi:hypothetical protein JCM8097_003844 [Rhodosporidiobolus ruineniae]